MLYVPHVLVTFVTGTNVVYDLHILTFSNVKRVVRSPP